MLAHFDGRPRSGKSVQAVIIASLLDKTFLKNFDKRIVHSSADFLNQVEEIKKSGIKGCVIIVDEAGESMASTSWYEDMSRAISSTTQVFGYLQIIVFFVSPVRDFILNSMRKMTNVYCNVTRKSKLESSLRFYHISYNTIAQKTYYQVPKISVFDEQKTLWRIRFRNIPADILEQYQALEQDRKPGILDRVKTASNNKEAKRTQRISPEERRTQMASLIEAVGIAYKDQPLTARYSSKFVEKYTISNAMALDIINAHNLRLQEKAEKSKKGR